MKDEVVRLNEFNNFLDTPQETMLSEPVSGDEAWLSEVFRV
jgi:hypothetical protein